MGRVSDGTAARYEYGQLGGVAGTDRQIRIWQGAGVGPSNARHSVFTRRARGVGIVCIDTGVRSERAEMSPSL